MPQMLPEPWRHPGACGPDRGAKPPNHDSVRFGHPSQPPGVNLCEYLDLDAVPREPMGELVDVALDSARMRDVARRDQPHPHVGGRRGLRPTRTWRQAATEIRSRRIVRSTRLPSRIV